MRLTKISGENKNKLLIINPNGNVTNVHIFLKLNEFRVAGFFRKHVKHVKLNLLSQILLFENFNFKFHIKLICFFYQNRMIDNEEKKVYLGPNPTTMKYFLTEIVKG